ncbi:MAG: ABC transporter permease [Acidimicrobiales bacterium]
MIVQGPDASQRPYSDVVQVFERNTLALPPLRAYLAELLDRRAFLVELARAEVRGQRSSTFLGELWSLIDPMFQALVYYLLFVVIRGGSGGGRATEFITAIIGSVFLFNYTRISISEGGRSILRHRGLVLNAIFPRALLPMAEVYKGFRSTLPAFAIYLVIHLAMRAPVTQAVFLIPLLLVIQTVMNLGLALLLSTATAYFNDVANLLTYILRLLTVATPVMYPVSLLTPALRGVLAWNPLFALFAAYQAIITGEAPAFGLILQSMVWATVTLVVGVWLFLRHERSFGIHI